MIAHSHHRHHHEHDGAEHKHGPGDRRAVSRRLLWVLGITATFMIAEVVGGVLSNSLALLADAGHMFADVAALALSVFAMRLSQRPATHRRTYGYARFEILAALINGATLLVIAGLIIVEAWGRLREPVAIDGVVMLSVAGLGLGVNLMGAALLHSHAHDNLNVRGAYLHVLGDLLGSVGAIAAGVVVLTTGWTAADPIISVVIALLILFSAWNLVREAADVLLESVPSHLDVESILASLRSIEGLDEVHDVHVWTLTSGFVALSGHGVIDDVTQHTRILGEIRERMGRFSIEHVTFQIEMRTLYQLPTR
ncbi:MAG: cation diffusion facilitator family transporter [Gemmatimonadetes bacterium]|nr:cation diffusion facilitator family transporter [Gemmatimonadota bacterium]MDA1103428.1 cation diffusion facilitator family transporter [Gemmatimonadota bacterium]